MRGGGVARPGWRVLVLLLALVLAAALRADPAAAERRVALVIGNSAYASVPKLANPRRDASAVASTLRRAGFDVVEEAYDLDGIAMRDRLRRFGIEAEGADIALVYYAGHGIEVNGINYLIPTDARLRSDRDADFEALPLGLVQRATEPARRLQLIILDACRDNPFTAMKRTLGSTRAVQRGLARVEPDADTLIAYAARDGTTASDGRDGNSPFASALIKYLATPGLDVRILFGKVRDEVKRATSGVQEPFVYGSLGGDEVYLVETKKQGVSAGLLDNPQAAPSTPARPKVALATPSTAPKQPSAPVTATEAIRRRLGLFPEAVTAANARAMGLDRARGTRVGGISPTGPADRSGIKPGDVITRYGDQEIGTLDDLGYAVGATGQGQTVTVQVLRKGKLQVIQVQPGGLKLDLPRLAAVTPTAPVASGRCDENAAGSLRSKLLPLRVCYDESLWKATGGATGYEFKFAKNNRALYGGLVTTAVALDETLMRQTIIGDVMSSAKVKRSEVFVTKQASATINGHKWQILHLTAPFGGAKYRYVNYYSKIPGKGSVQLVFWTVDQHFQAEFPSMEQIAATLTVTK